MTRLIMEGSLIRLQERNVRFKLKTHELRGRRSDLISMYIYSSDGHLLRIDSKKMRPY